MVFIKIEKGNKGSKDRIIRIWANGEIFTIEDILKMIDFIFKNEDEIYPISQGYDGRAYFLKAIIDLACGIPLERILENYKLKRKNNSVKVIEKLHEILE
jgi:hypothetical protein